MACASWGTFYGSNVRVPLASESASIHTLFASERDDELASHFVRRLHAELTE